jgi:protein-L-isoaspartate(D-aspartate) O-methyltransferase
MNVPGTLRKRYVDELRRDGVIDSPALAAAFASVPREVFVAHGFQRRDGGWVGTGDADFLDTVYRDDVLITKVADGIPVSSSSQPSLMAIMLAALDVRPGMRVLEIGAGTGYNAALLAALGARVTSVDVQPDVVERARSALDAAGVTGVTVVLGDGYRGEPAGGPYDRVIVTVGVHGISPHWLGQVAGDGFVVAPVRHAGNHPVLAVRRGPGGAVTATGICHAGFMTAAGPLSADHPWARPAALRASALPAPTVVVPPRWQPALPVVTYCDLWFAAGVWHPRATSAPLETAPHGGCVLLDEERTGGAAILPDGAVRAVGADAGHYAREAVGLLDRWEDAGRPALSAWSAELTLAGDADAPIWVPCRWELDR